MFRARGVRALGFFLLASLAAAAGWCAIADAQVRRPARAIPSRASRPTTPSGYYRIVRAWHTPTAGKTPGRERAPRARAPRHVHRRDSGDAGAVGEGGLQRRGPQSSGARAARAGDRQCAPSRASNDRHALPGYETHFEAQEIRVMSAVRTPVPGNGQGLVAKEGRLASSSPAHPTWTSRGTPGSSASWGWASTQSGLSSTWTCASGATSDRSGPEPGARAASAGILLDVAERSDAAARARGELPPNPFGIGADVNAALRATAAANADSDEDEEDEQE